MSEAESKKTFAAEFATSWRALPDKGFFATLLVVWLTLFQCLGNSALGFVKTQSLFGWLKFVWDTSPDDQHCVLVPFAVAFLFWDRRTQLLAVPKRNWWPALALVIAGLLLHWLGFAVHQTRISGVGFFTGLFGLTGLVWGWAWLRASFFPFFIFGFCLPLATLAEPLSQPLRVIVSQAVVALARLGGADVQRVGTQIFDAARTFNYDIVPACSGIRSVTMMFTLTTIFAFVSFATWWRRGVMLLAAIPIAIAGNVARLTLVIFISELFGQDAGSWVEQKLGFLTFLIALGCVIGLARLLREKISEDVK
ncbi:MAG: hypothetical protein RLZZ350_2416 [Verrucomicrobiota bacterium]|jgi:exosortase